MNNLENDITLVEKYFDETLSNAERENFTRKMLTDSNFKTLVEQEKLLIGAIRYQGLQEDLQYLKGVEKSLNDAKVVRFKASSKKWYYLAAAAVVGMLIAANFLLMPRTSSEELFQAYFKPYPNLFEPTVRGVNTPDDRTAAFQAYEQGDYQTAAVKFNAMLKTKEEPGVLLLLGNSNLILGNLDEAKGNFITLNSHFDELDIQAKWFLSLCYLKSGDMEKARPILSELGNTDISYAAKAKELLSKVK
ncbi:MAG TPA: hypothetical protein VK666_19550 [Chryseolinea sp.]|nr:hypothetical protein [Chryseolinea sp.]